METTRASIARGTARGRDKVDHTLVSSKYKEGSSPVRQEREYVSKEAFPSFDESRE